jgi:hypothetical protein
MLWSRFCNFFAKFFGENILIIITSVPAFINFDKLSSILINFHQLWPTLINFNNFINCDQLSSILMKFWPNLVSFDQRSSVLTNFHQSMFIHLTNINQIWPGFYPCWPTVLLCIRKELLML